MELMQLEMFVAIVEERSVHKAAERVFRTQPAVSIALTKLEQEIGAPLLDRSRRRDYRLTQAGEVLYEYASRIIGLRNEALSLLQDDGRACTGRLCVGVNGAANLRWIPQLTATFGHQYPDVRVEVLCDRPEKLIRELVDRKVDLALLAAQPEHHVANADLVMTLVSAFGRERSLWVVQRRVGRSHIAKAFEEMLISLAKENGARREPSRPQPRNPYSRKLRAETSELRGEER
jgi:DNA-binding transcriptional LysR family regulator